jgi:uncharacterized protein (DUF1499 family)
MRRVTYAALGTTILIAAVVIGLLRLGARSRQVPGPAGVRDGALLPCPDSPNCVVSMGGDSSHSVEPLRFEGDPAEAMRRLHDVVASLPGARIEMESPEYLHAEVRSHLFGFVDDVECLIDAAGARIDIRSASRVGYGDLGANRARAGLIARRFREAAGS